MIIGSNVVYPGHVRPIVLRWLVVLYSVLKNDHGFYNKTNGCMVMFQSGETKVFFPRINGRNSPVITLHAEEVALNYIMRKGYRIKYMYLFSIYHDRSSNEYTIGIGNCCERCYRLLVRSGIVSKYIGVLTPEFSDQNVLIRKGKYMMTNGVVVNISGDMGYVSLSVPSTHKYKSGRSGHHCHSCCRSLSPK